jgi:hypothetical protein
MFREPPVLVLCGVRASPLIGVIDSGISEAEEKANNAANVMLNIELLPFRILSGTDHLAVFHLSAVFPDRYE